MSVVSGGAIPQSAVARQNATVNLGTLDLNLMVALDALLTEVNVTRAAERLNLAQPTVSASLARLRRHFGDDLLWRNGNQLELTPLAVRLRPLVAEAVAATDALFSAHVDVDPTRSARRFAIVASDYGLNVAGVRWSRRVARRAPGVRLAFLTLAVAALTPAEVRMRDVDGVLAPHGLLPETMPHRDVLEDRWVVVADARDQSLSSRPTVKDLQDRPWVSAFEDPSSTPAGMNRHDWARLAGQMTTVVPTFTAIPACVRDTPRVALMQARLLADLDPAGTLRVLEPPLPIEPIRLAFWWHPTYSADVEHAWLRAQLGSVPTPVDADGQDDPSSPTAPGATP